MVIAEDKADFYRDRANLLRTQAGVAKLPETRWQLLNIARLFDKLAARIREREQMRAAAD